MKFLGLLFVIPLMAFAFIEGDKADALIIDAEQGLVCDARGNLCTAFGPVKATKGTSVLTCQKMVAHFHGMAGKRKELATLECQEDVIFRDLKAGYKATGKRGFYDAHAKRLMLEGAPVLSDPQATVFVGQKIIFEEATNKAIVTGRSTLRRQQHLLQADLMRVYFQKNAAGQLVFERLEAEGNVILSTPSEVAHGKRGIYRATLNTAELYDDVTLTRPSGQLKGNYAKYDMAKGQGQLYNVSEIGNPSSRVQVLLKPLKKN
jgi:lipopolysaccharide export system protein LptA